MKLHEFMTTELKTVNADETVYEAIEKMVDLRIRSLLVDYGGKITDQGVVTARDVVFKVLAKGVDPNSIKVAQIAARPITCVDADMEIFEAAKMMEELNLARIFVCNEGVITGVVSMIDVMAAALIMRAKGEYVSA